MSVIFLLHKLTRSLNVLYELAAGQQESNVIMNKKDLKTKLYMHNTTDDVALTNIYRETNYFHDSVLYPKQQFFTFPQPLKYSQHILASSPVSLYRLAPLAWSLSFIQNGGW